MQLWRPFVPHPDVPGELWRSADDPESPGACRAPIGQPGRL